MTPASKSSPPRPLALLLASSLLLAAPLAHAASPEWESPTVSHKDVKPYFDASLLYQQLLAPPPAEGSLIDADDVAAIRARQTLPPARVAEAEADADWLYDRFAQALAVPAIQRDKLPALVHLLNRSVRQVGRPAFAAKRAHPRLRPYQRLQGIHVCGENGASKPDPDSQRRTSYPSGHAAYGWTVALVLAAVQPARTAALLQRAADYADSRLICGMHFPSDVQAARQLATAVVVQLQANAEFQQDLERARTELQSHAR